VHRRSTLASSVLLLAALAAPLASSSAAQSLIATHGTLVAYSNMPAPGVPGATANFFGFAGPIVDDAGNVAFPARLTGGPVTFGDDMALLHGPNVAGLTIFAREGGAAPGLPGVTLSHASFDTPSQSCRVTNGGKLIFASRLSGAGVTSANDGGLFVGPLGSYALAARKGMAAPGTAGAVFASNFADLIETQMWSNAAGDVAFFSQLSGGDVVGTTNNMGVWSGPLGAPLLAFRRGMSLPGGAVIASFQTNTSNLSTNGRVRALVTLSTTTGSPPATTLTDDALLVYVPGSGVSYVAREGDPAPGTVGALFGDASGIIALGVSHRSFDSNGNYLFSSTLKSGDVTPGLNDRAIYRGGPAGLLQVFRKGDPAPGTGGGTFDDPAPNALNMNDVGRVLFMARINGGTLPSTFGLFTGSPAPLSCLVRTGDPAPGTLGAQILITPAGAVLMNEPGDVLFHCNLVAGVGDTTAANDDMVVHYSPSSGMRRVVRQGDVLTLPSGAKTVDSWILSQMASGETGTAALKNSGKFAIIVYFTDGTEAVYVVDPPNTGHAFCASDGSLTDHTTPCPCGNTGAAGNGCAHSFNPAGANLSASGTVAADDVVLLATGLPTTSFTLFMQHDAPGDTVFHDGVLCAGGGLVRLRGRNAVAGVASFPNSLFANDVTTTLSQRGSVTIGSGALRFYAAFYRNASTTFCPPATANVTNGWRIVW